MTDQLQKLCDLDHLIEQTLKTNDFVAEEIVQMVDKREQLLQSLIPYVVEHPQVAESKQWRDAISHTQQLVELMQSKTSLIGEQLRRYRHGNKSVQQYKKFL